MIDKFDGRYRFLSNFYPCEIEHQGIKYNSVESFYVAMKCNNEQLFNGTQYTINDFREMIACMNNPGLVKRIGQQMRVRSDWDTKRLDYMNWAVREKFKDENLKELLISTGDLTLIEGNYWHDNFYGQCTCDKCSGKGKNNLGKILMEVRNELNGIIKQDFLGDILKQSVKK